MFFAHRAKQFTDWPFTKHAVALELTDGVVNIRTSRQTGNVEACSAAANDGMTASNCQKSSCASASRQFDVNEGSSAASPSGKGRQNAVKQHVTDEGKPTKTQKREKRHGHADSEGEDPCSIFQL